MRSLDQEERKGDLRPLAQPGESGQAREPQVFLLTLCIGLALILVTLYALSRICSYSKELDWLVYELLAVVGAVVLFGLSFVLTPARTPLTAYRIGLLVSGGIVLVTGWHFMRAAGPPPFYARWCLVLAWAPACGYVLESRKGAQEGHAADRWNRWTGFFAVGVTNVLGVAAAMTFFDFGESTFAWMLVAACALSTLAYAWHRRPGRGRTPITSCSLAPRPGKCRGSTRGRFYVPYPLRFLLAGAVVALLTAEPVDHFHTNYYIGPALDVTLGKSILLDTPSVYGYLSIHFLVLLLKVTGVGFVALNVLDWLMTGLVFAFTYAILRRICREPLARLLSLAIIGAWTVCCTPDPVAGPMRYGLLVMVCWSLVCLPQRWRYAAGGLFSAVAAFWAMDTAIQIAPAWLCACGVSVIQSYTTSKAAIRGLCKRLIFFVSVCLAILALIVAYESQHGHIAQAVKSVLELVALRTTSYCQHARPIPYYGAHYFAILIAVAGLVTATHLLVNHRRSPWLVLAVFLAVHNVAVLGRFINCPKSWLITQLALPYFFQFLLIWRVMRDDMGLSRRQIERALMLPVTFFSLAITALVGLATPDVIALVGEAYGDVFHTVRAPSQAGPEAEPLLRGVQRLYGRAGRDVAVISEGIGTAMLVKARMKNALPLNPINMTVDAEPPDWIEAWIAPVMESLPLGSLVVFDSGIRASKVMGALLERFELERLAVLRRDDVPRPWSHVADQMNVGVYRIQSRRTERLDSAEAVLRACREGLSIDPQSVMAFTALPGWFRDSADVQGFVSVCREVAQESPEAGVPHLVLGVTLAAAGDAENALRALSRACALGLPTEQLQQQLEEQIRPLEDALHQHGSASSIDLADLPILHDPFLHEFVLLGRQLRQARGGRHRPRLDPDRRRAGPSTE